MGRRCSGAGRRCSGAGRRCRVGRRCSGVGRRCRVWGGDVVGMRRCSEMWWDGEM